MMSIEVSMITSWIIKGILRVWLRIHEVQNYYTSSLISNRFSMGSVSKLLRNAHDSVDWYDLVASNNARPRAITCLWLAFHRRLATKDHLAKWTLITEVKYCFCYENEEFDHLFFVCARIK